MLYPFKQNIFVCGAGVPAPVLDSGICGLWRTPGYDPAAIVASRWCLLVKETGPPDSGMKTRKSQALVSIELRFLQMVFR